MASSVVEIINGALSEIGNTNFIDDLDDQTEEARIASVIWDQSLKRTLESAFSWSFASRRKRLSIRAGVSITNWEYAYSLPGDFLKLQSIVINGAEVHEDQVRDLYLLESLEDKSRVILFNESELEIKYTYFNDNVSVYSALFVDALTLLLSAKFCRALKADLKTAASIESAFYLKVAEASAADRNQSSRPADPRTPSLAARGG